MRSRTVILKKQQAMNRHQVPIIFTDLDGTLLGSQDYSYEPTLPLLKTLQERHIPVIPVTSKTRAEVEALCQQIGLTDPFIVENGSAVFIPDTEDRLILSKCESWENYRVLRLGCTYLEAREGLKALSEALGEPLQGFGDLSLEQLQQLTNLPREAAQQAKTREFTEPFVTPKTIASTQIEQAVNLLGFQVTIGDRFSHLIGKGAGKGNAVKRLGEAYQAVMPTAQLITIGLGNSPNDLEMLAAVDYPIVIPGEKGVHPGLQDRPWRVAPTPAPQGWAEAIKGIWQELEI